MNKHRIAINGFGRIGRMVFRKAIMDSSIDVVAINASYPAETLAHLIKYDSIHGRLDADVKALQNGIEVDGHFVQLVSNRNPEQLPWDELQVDIVIEATGKFKTTDTASAHIDAGAKKVIITAPGKGKVDGTFVVGVNEEQYDPEKHHVISNASCTTNCLAPVVKVLDEHFGIINGMMTTVHAFTNDQNNIDNPHKDLRRARSCTQSIIPTSTGAAKAIGEVLPEMNGKLHGMALRVPTPNVSLVDLVVDVNAEVTLDDINEAFKQEANNRLNGILAYSDEPLVSIDYTTTEYSSIVDGLSTIVLEDKKVKVLAWYDNEWGYSCRVVDLAKLVGSKLEQKTAHTVS
ncbi:glyceraldehyde-3-phosphate dehydrogenase [Salinibacillus xinjiangensis]|uniref:Glyceraldehyde-3-phosphate dehydrogenase n=1 Tax=Salinibacillus xinjiangensis TaxID=1229268 RepID=A0A6G1X9P8_9BACI|nr:glyceraldehyde-3-phosphate dehydrogenase [Salinibacillus xinjiangensis]MRG87667.1 glyceraldehyde-3-phosphate dehydrogenase [Salinibacillus xinjiangensis]